MAGTDTDRCATLRAGTEQTQARIEAHLPPVLAEVVHGYIRPNMAVPARMSAAIIEAGHGELFEKEVAKNGVEWGLDQACLYGSMEFAELMVSRGARTFTRGLKLAVRGMMVSRGARTFTRGLKLAARGMMDAEYCNRRCSAEIVRYMLRLGAVKLPRRLNEACNGRDWELAKLLVECGADDEEAFEIACSAGHLETAKLIMDRRDVSLNRGLTVACENAHRPIAELMLARGAKKCYTCGVLAAEHWGAEPVIESTEWITTCAPNGAYDSDDA